MRAGIVGYGLAGRYFHGPTLVSAGFEVAAICARSLDKKAAAHEDFPNAILVNSVAELVDEDLDLIVIASTNDVHAEHARIAIDAGIATVVDKPLGRDYYESLALFDYADAQNVPLTVFFNRLWDSDSLTIKKALSENVIGRVFRVDSRFERFRPELSPSAWRENASFEAGGGLLLDLQTHLVSTALDWFGPAQLVHSSVREIRGAANDDVVLVLKHDSGVDSYLSASAIVGAPGPKLRMNGDNGSLVITELDRQEDLLRKGFKAAPGTWLPSEDITSEARIHKGSDSFSYSGVPGAYPDFYRQMRDCLDLDAALPVSREFALNVARIIDQAREISIH